jgi:hypothetical protein
MASRSPIKNRDQIADDIVGKIDAYLDGSVAAAEASVWAREFYKEDWLHDDEIISGAIDALAFLGPTGHHTQPDELRMYRACLLGEQDYVVHHRYVRSKAK